MVVDSSALLAILLGEPEGEALAAALAAAPTAVLSAPNWLESMIVISARLGGPGAAALTQLLDVAQVQLLPADEALCRIAFDAWRRFGKRRQPAGLNYGDCFAYALAAQRGDALLFKGDDFSRTDVQSALVVGRKKS